MSFCCSLMLLQYESCSAHEPTWQNVKACLRIISNPLLFPWTNTTCTDCLRDMQAWSEKTLAPFAFTLSTEGHCVDHCTGLSDSHLKAFYLQNSNCVVNMIRSFSVFSAMNNLILWFVDVTKGWYCEFDWNLTYPSTKFTLSMQNFQECSTRLLSQKNCCSDRSL